MAINENNRRGVSSAKVPTRRNGVTKGSVKRVKRKRSSVRQGCFLKLLIAVFLFILILCFVNKYIKNDMSTGDDVKEISFSIPDGSSANDIAEILEYEGVIDSAAHFKTLCKIHFEGSEFKSGYYTLTNNMEFEAIASILNEGGSNEGAMRLTVKEGMWLTEIAAEVSSIGICTYDEFMEASNSRDYDYDFVKDIPDRDNLLEGYLYPNTYFLYEGMTAHDIVDMLLNEFNKQITKNDISDMIKDKDTTLDEIVTIASLIEAEVKYEPERALVSSVIYNRLNSDTKLQIDASVIYSMGERVNRVYEKDLKTESDYNTYYVTGLPKGPINSPRIASIIAACEPENTKYMFYVVSDTESGQHKFCETYDEFLAAKKDYLAKVN